jgi:hypothetical protein
MPMGLLTARLVVGETETVALLSTLFHTVMRMQLSIQEHTSGRLRRALRDSGAC